MFNLFIRTSFWPFVSFIAVRRSSKIPWIIPKFDGDIGCLFPSLKFFLDTWKIIKKIRSVIYVEESDGCIVRYPKSKSRSNAKNKGVVSEIVSKLPKAMVVLKCLSPEEISLIQAKLKRDGKIKTIKDKIKQLPGKVFILKCFVWNSI